MPDLFEDHISIEPASYVSILEIFSFDRLEAFYLGKNILILDERDRPVIFSDGYEMRGIDLLDPLCDKKPQVVFFLIQGGFWGEFKLEQLAVCVIESCQSRVYIGLAPGDLRILIGREGIFKNFCFRSFRLWFLLFFLFLLGEFLDFCGRLFL